MRHPIVRTAVWCRSAWSSTCHVHVAYDGRTRGWLDYCRLETPSDFFMDGATDWWAIELVTRLYGEEAPFLALVLVAKLARRPDGSVRIAWRHETAARYDRGPDPSPFVSALAEVAWPTTTEFVPAWFELVAERARTVELFEPDPEFASDPRRFVTYAVASHRSARYLIPRLKCAALLTAEERLDLDEELRYADSRVRLDVETRERCGV